MDQSGDNRITNPSASEQGRRFDEICERRNARRRFLKSSLVLSAAGVGLPAAGCVSDEPVSDKTKKASRFNFVEIAHGGDEHHLVAPDHSAEVLIRWGDPLFADSPVFDPLKQTGESQSKQFGYNNDYVGYLALEPSAGQQARALLCVNHEYPQHGLMFSNFDATDKSQMTPERVAVSQASVGASVVEVVQQDGAWSVNTNSPYNRRISALDTEIKITGPAAGHRRMKTSADPTGKAVIGTMNNCAGGMTPWDTYLICEENINFHFGGKLAKNNAESKNHKRMNLPIDATFWAQHDSRFDVGKEPNEANRFGWVVEIDPLDPMSKPKKRTALGRFKHEGAENVISPSGQLVIYMGDDQRFEYLYKFVSRDKVDLDSPMANRDLLDNGTLYVAQFHDDGYLDWLPLSYQNELLAKAFASQADILIEARRAADLLGATPMDRPEDVVPNPKTGKVYVMLTNNTKRKETNAANQRTNNKFGHIIELNELEGDFAGVRAQWDTLVLCGNPNDFSHAAKWHPSTSENGWFASPDNGVVDPAGRLWVSSDQGSKVNLSGTNDGLWALETQGEARGTGKMFFRVPMGAELCGPAFSDNAENLFVAVQHPGDFPEFNRATFEKPSTRWPDFDDNVPPRPSVMVIRKNGGGKVG